jgi:hypothetical protein
LIIDSIIFGLTLLSYFSLFFKVHKQKGHYKENIQKLKELQASVLMKKKVNVGIKDLMMAKRI